MKKVFLLTALIATLFASATPEPSVNDKVLRAFKETFKNARDISWHEFNDYSQASFKLEEIQFRAQYADDATLIKMIRYYKEDQLLPMITAKLKKKYTGKEIFGITETASADEVQFVINIKDDNYWYVVQSDVFGNLKELDKYRRADK